MSQKAKKKTSTSSSELADALRSAKTVVMVTGAGISVNAGIPDFRSEGTGLYYNLQHYFLPHPMAIFYIDYFKYRPRPFFSLQKELFPSKNYFPTFTHAFIAYLEQQGKLVLDITQNIDGLEHYAGIQNKLLAHGAFSLPALCNQCKREYSTLTVKAAAFDEAVPTCVCGGIIKPYIVFFGEPVKIDETLLLDACKSDVCLVVGTSLNVGPVNQIPSFCAGKKALINKETAGEYIDWDFYLLGDCDAVLKDVCTQLGCTSTVEELLQKMRQYIKQMDDCFLTAEPQDLELIALAGELIIPTACYLEIDGTTIMLALSTQQQISRLIECSSDIFPLEVPKSKIPEDFYPYLKHDALQCYSKGNAGSTIYKPIDGHFSSYLFKFQEHFIANDDENDLWDVLTRYAGTKTGDKIILQNRSGQSQMANTNTVNLIGEGYDDVEAYDFQALLGRRIRKVITYVEKNDVSAVVLRVDMVANVSLAEDVEIQQLVARSRMLSNYIEQEIGKVMKSHPLLVDCATDGARLLIALEFCHKDVWQYDKKGVMKAVECVLRKCYPEIVNVQLRK